MSTAETMRHYENLLLKVTNCTATEAERNEFKRMTLLDANRIEKTLNERVCLLERQVSIAMQQRTPNQLYVEHVAKALNELRGELQAIAQDMEKAANNCARLANKIIGDV